MAQLVDAIGGVDFDVPYNMHYDDPTQDLHIHFEKGMQHLDGENAVKLLRWRKNNSGESLSVGDIGRVEIQHSFLKAMAEQTVRLGNITKIRQIASIVEKNLTSNLTYGEMLWFGEQALGLKKENIHFYGLPGDFTGTIWSPTYQNYQSYVFVNPTALLELVNEHLNPYLTPIKEEEQHVLHGTTVNNEPTLPDSTGLPIITEQPTGNEMELPSGAIQPPAPPPANPSKPSEPQTSAETSTGTSSSPEEGSGAPAAQPTQTEPAEPVTPVSEPEPTPEPAHEPAPEPAPAPAPDPAPAPAPAPEPAPAPAAEAPAAATEE